MNADDDSVLHRGTAAPDPRRTLDPDHTALVLIDLQEAFFSDPDLEAERDRLVDRTNLLLAAAREAGVPVVEVRTEHRRDRSTWTLNMLEDDQGFAFAGTDETGPLAGLEVSGTHVVRKTRDSAFHGTSLATWLLDHAVRSVVLVGVSTHACVAMTAADAFAHDLHVGLVRDAVHSEQPEDGARALEVLEREYRCDVLTAEELAGRWSSAS